MSTNGKSRRGFASMDPEKVREIASMGGQTAHAIGRAHEFTSEEASQAGTLGGAAAHAQGKAHQFTPAEARKAGRKGRLARARRRWGGSVPPTCRQCNRRSSARGLCVRCYKRSQYQVKAGKTTWRALEAAGLARPLVEQIGEGG
jgi:general stress protein YciG